MREEDGVQLKTMKRIDEFDNPLSVETNGSACDKKNGEVLKPEKEKEKKEEKKNKEEYEDVSYFGLFRFAECPEVLMIILGTVGACAVGCGPPINFLLFGNVLDQFVGKGAKDYAKSRNITIIDGPSLPTTENLSAVVFVLTKWFLVLAACLFVAGFIQMVGWQYSALRQIMRIRMRLFESMVYQDVTWHDQHATGDLVTRLSDQVNTIQSGIGEKMAVFLQYFTTFLAGLALGFARGWKLTLIVFASIPLLALSIGGVGYVMKRLTMREIRAYGVAGAIAEEVLFAVRTVVAFGGEKKEGTRYRENLKLAEKAGIFKAVMFGITVGSTGAIIYATAALCFWYGGEIIITEKVNPGLVLQVFFCTFVGGISLGNAAQSLEDFWNAKGAAGNTFPVIKRKPNVDTRAKGDQLENLQGRIEFRNVNFTYPTRPDVQVLNGLSFSVEPGQTVALVGESGSGKSTVMQLVQRFYDCASGDVLIDDQPIQKLDLSWLRQHVGVVQQEPLLFAGSVAENIRLGRLNASDKEVRDAAKMANAHNFIKKIPGNYDAVIGEGGGQLSGGQKQRVAIARALVRHPRILLLDEATSALDNRSEAVVQEALDTAAASRDCTVLMIAHRLSTVRNADRIIVMSSGTMVEEGSHEELMAAKGHYYRLVLKQNGNRNISSSISSDPAKGLSGVSEGEVLLTDTEDLPIADASADDLTAVVADGSSKEEEKEKKERKPRTFPVMMKALMMNGPEAGYVTVGIITAFLAGALMPVFSLIYSEILRVYSEFATPDLMRERTRLFCGLMGASGALSLILQTVKNWSFGVSGERLTLRMRAQTFEAMLSQEIGWYDCKENQPGSLTSRLATDASYVKAVTGVRLGTFAEAFVTLSASLIIAFVYGWKLTFVVLAFVPLLIGVGMIQGRAHASRSNVKVNAKKGSDTSCIAQETLSNIRTVISLNRQEYFIKKYYDSYEAETKLAFRRSLLFGLFSGVAQAVLYCSNAAVFTYGAKLIDDGEMQFFNVFRVFAAINFGSTAMGRASSFLPDMGKATKGTVNIFNLLERKSLINVQEDSGVKPSETSQGVVKFDSVDFSYPTRSNVPVLRDLTLEAQPGQTVALVGESGCGKSTLVQLAMRFYDVEGGQVMLDGHSTKELSVNWLRAQIGLVSQEPILFNYSIRENIAYGDNSRQVPMTDIIEVAREANIHDFIASLPEGYETRVGSRGGQMSGGQKQRIAIARALVRKPTILLLDEATSALDTNSEKVVQEALDRARKGRTCLVIAHRLSTIESADMIAVIDNGRVVEVGTHQELMMKRGNYYLIHTGKTS